MTDIATVTPASPPATPDAGSPAPSTTSVEAAHARRAEILGDKAVGKKLRDGDATLVAEWHSLNKIIAEAGTPEARLENAMVGVPAAGIEQTTDENPLSTSQLYSAVKNLREGGASDAVIRDIVKGAEITKEQSEAFHAFKKRCMADRGWRTRYLAGDMDARRDFHLFTAGVTAPIAAGK